MGTYGGRTSAQTKPSRSDPGRRAAPAPNRLAGLEADQRALRVDHDIQAPLVQVGGANGVWTDDLVPALLAHRQRNGLVDGETPVLVRPTRVQEASLSTSDPRRGLSAHTCR
jgi:hypothetical protein